MTSRPRGKLAGAPSVVRHLWSLLYRAVRRQARAVDELLGVVDVHRRVLGGHQNTLESHREVIARTEDGLVELRAEVRLLSERVADLEDPS